MVDTLTREHLDHDDPETNPNVYPPAGPFPVPPDAHLTAGWLEAPELANVGRELIGDREDLEHLAHASICYLWKRKAPSERGAPKPAGVTPKGGGPQGYRAGSDFFIWVAADLARQRALTRPAIVALVRHQLFHIKEHPEHGGLIIVGPDFAGFHAELEGPLPLPTWVEAAIYRQERLTLPDDEHDGGDDDAGDDEGEGT